MQRLHNRMPEIVGFSLIGLGVLLLLSSLFYIPLFLRAGIVEQTNLIYSANAILPGHQIGILMLLLACSAITAGYLVINKHTANQSNLLIWLTIIEVLAESSILGWLLIMTGIVLPLPSSTWSIYSASWLARFFGGPGALIFPLFVAGVCFYLKRNLRKFGSLGKLLKAHKG